MVKSYLILLMSIYRHKRTVRPSISASAADILYLPELGNKTTISYLYVQQSKVLPRGGVNDLMHCSRRPRATVHSVIHSTEGVKVLTVAQKGMK